MLILNQQGLKFPSKCVKSLLFSFLTFSIIFLIFTASIADSQPTSKPKDLDEAMKSGMQIRRVVTGQSPDGKSIFVSDEMVDPITLSLAPGLEFYNMWGADNTVTLPSDGSMPPTKTFFPPVGGFRFSISTIPPLSTKGPENIDMEAAIAEAEEKMPGFLKHGEPENPGMHTSDTVDFEYIISGEVWLELDDGKQVHLKPGDTVIQNGTRHAWRNKGTEPCRFVSILIGAIRK